MKLSTTDTRQVVYGSWIQVEDADTTDHLQCFAFRPADDQGVGVGELGLGIEIWQADPEFPRGEAHTALAVVALEIDEAEALVACLRDAIAEVRSGVLSEPPDGSDDRPVLVPSSS